MTTEEPDEYIARIDEAGDWTVCTYCGSEAPTRMYEVYGSDVKQYEPICSLCAETEIGSQVKSRYIHQITPRAFAQGVNMILNAIRVMNEKESH